MRGLGVVAAAGVTATPPTGPADAVRKVRQLIAEAMPHRRRPNRPAGHVPNAIACASDLVLCDAMMPEPCSHGVVQILRTDPQHTSTLPLNVLPARVGSTDTCGSG